MNLLLINFEMNPRSPALAWQYSVALALSRHFEHVTVITERVDAAVPHNMNVITIPRWWLKAPFRWMGAKWLLNVLVYRLLRHRHFDACFFHMNMEWAYRLSGCLRRFKIPTLLWYAHGAVTWRLRLAHRCVDRVVTSSVDGFRIVSSKRRIIGQGIDTQLFCLREGGRPRRDLVAVGRISRRKRIDLMLQVMAELRRLRPTENIRLIIVGVPLTRDDRRYAKMLRRQAADLNIDERVTFAGSLPLNELPAVYQSARLQLHLSQTGSMDKSVLEGLACGCPVLTTSKAFRSLFKNETLSSQLCGDAESSTAIAEQLLRQLEVAYDEESLRTCVKGTNDLDQYAALVVEEIYKMRSHPPGLSIARTA